MFFYSRFIGVVLQQTFDVLDNKLTCWSCNSVTATLELASRSVRQFMFERNLILKNQ